MTGSDQSRAIWRKTKRRRPIPRSFVLYSGVFLFVIALVVIGYRPPEQVGSAASAVDTAGSSTVAPTVDDVIASQVAANIATTTDLPIATNVANLSQSLAAENALAQNDSNIVAKPQVVQATADNRSVQYYTTKSGDTATSVGEKYGISAQTVRWANDLTSDALEPNKKLKILPVDGVLYTTQADDTVASIASKYSANAERIKLYNDLDLTKSLKPNIQLIIPGGALPEAERPGYVSPTLSITNGASNNYSGGYATSNNFSASVGNRYVYGQCTWYVYERRAQLGRPVGSFWGNASTWAYYASQAGFTVNQTPAVGAVMQNGGGYGHVSIVEAVNPGVSVTISEMNAYRFGGGYARIGHGDIPWSDAVSGYYNYIH